VDRRGGIGGIAGGDADAQRLAPPGQADPALGPDDAVLARDVEQVEVEVEALGPRSQPGPLALARHGRRRRRAGGGIAHGVSRA